MTARQTLRAATADDHERVDALFSAFDLSTREGYCAFLAAQAEPFLSTEAELEQAGIGRLISDWPHRKRGHLLAEDFASLCSGEGRSPDEGTAVAGLLLPQEHNDAALLGALYVLEGSRLGGKLLARSVPPHFPTRFLSASALRGAWPSLLEMLDEFLYDSARIDAAVGAARAVFQRFELGAKRVLELELA
ncbi:biliverdin-producing heme oxygenase [Allosphingosinicella vermicomposti]|uniref:biliverdin-producing heme oxygenase n=1 Tax=Allosphingosinicella vermicomposti TaxID=614671 RepID=UPI001FE1F0FD|nr:biliverdin-producing heme oxygenase [Allosphingosinicella vermicomposti]